MGLNIAKKLSLNDILIKYACSDGDARSVDGLSHGFKAINPMWEVVRQSDTTHLGMSQYKKLLKATFSKDFFPPNIHLKADKDHLQKCLAEDLRSRCHIIHNNLYNDCEGNLEKMSKKVKVIVKRLIKCYSGEHKYCTRGVVGKTLGCFGKPRNNWFTKSVYFSTLTYKINGFQMTLNDQAILAEIIKMKLARDSLHNIKLNLNTNKNEAIHRAYSSSLPKNVKYSRNVFGRIHSTVHRLNNKIGDSLHIKLEKVGAEITKGSVVAKSIQSIQRESEYQTSYGNKLATKVRVSNRQRNQRLQYNKAKNSKKFRDLYEKGQLDEEQVELHRKRTKKDHPYAE